MTGRQLPIGCIDPSRIWHAIYFSPLTSPSVFGTISSDGLGGV